jgi:hypothetical protein
MADPVLGARQYHHRPPVRPRTITASASKTMVITHPAAAMQPIGPVELPWDDTLTGAAQWGQPPVGGIVGCWRWDLPEVVAA